MSMFCTLRQSVDNIDVRFLLHLTPKNLPKMTILNFRLNVCDFVRMTHKEKLFKIFMEQVKNYVNFPLVCPLKAVSCFV